jgi:putative hydrolase of the HAD superfamily
MQASGLKGYFLQVIHSEEAGVRKPHPGIFNYALRLAGARVEDSLMIGDDWEADILGARDVGIDQVFLTTTEEMLQSMSGVSGNVMARHNYQPTHTIGALADLREII